MKNLYIIPTDKPSRLHFDDKLFLSTNIQISREINSIVGGRNIYITSNEEIKEEDWLFSTKTNNLFKADSIEYLGGYNMIEDFNKSFYINSKYAKKIILTTDLDLIKDGVQAIDDEFLEWFVKNTSCEFVEVNDLYDYTNENLEYIGYKIIIPPDVFRITNISGVYTYYATFALAMSAAVSGDIIESFSNYTKEPEQESLEEVAERILFENTKNVEIRYSGERYSVIKSMIDLVKWQQEQDKNKYSKEEVKQIIEATLIEHSDFVLADIPDWFEQFSKLKNG